MKCFVDEIFPLFSRLNTKIIGLCGGPAQHSLTLEVLVALTFGEL